MSLPFRQSKYILVANCLLTLLMAGCGTRSTLSKAPATVVVVEATFAGANGKVLAETVAAPIEQQVNGVANALHLTSRCTNDGKYILVVTFKPGTDINVAQVTVRNRVALAMPLLPDAAQRHGVTVKKKSPVLLLVNLSSPKERFDSLYMSNYATVFLNDELVRLPDVGEVVPFGLPETNVRIILDAQKLAARQLTAADVAKALAKEEVQGGPIDQPPDPQGQQFQMPVITLGRLSDPEKFADLIVKTDGNGMMVRLKDVGRVERSNTTSNYVSLNGKPGVFLGIYPVRATRELSRTVQDKLTMLRAPLPEGLRLEVAFDFSVNLEAPTGPKTPQYLLIDLHVPHTSSRDRTVEVLKQCEKLLQKIPGVQDVLAQMENPFDFVRDRPCILLRLAPADQRKTSLQEITRTIRAELEKVPDAGSCLRDLTRPGSFPRFNYPVDLAVSGPELEKTQLLADKLAAALRKSGKLTDVSANQDFARRSKVATLEVDSPKAKAQSVSRADIFSTLQVYLGSVIVNDFALFGKTSQVVVPLDSINNKNIDDLMQLKVRNVKGEMVELKALMNVRQSDVSGAINRLDLQPYVQVTANPATDVSTAEGRTLCQRLFDDLRQESRLPGEYRLIWLQEK